MHLLYEKLMHLNLHVTNRSLKSNLGKANDKLKRAKDDLKQSKAELKKKPSRR